MLGIFGFLQNHFQREETIRSESKIDMLQAVETAHKERAVDQQSHRYRYFGDD